MIATQEFVVPRSIPMMSPARPLDESARRCCCWSTAAHSGAGLLAEGDPLMCASCRCDGGVGWVGGGGVGGRLCMSRGGHGWLYFLSTIILSSYRYIVILQQSILPPYGTKNTRNAPYSTVYTACTVFNIKVTEISRYYKEIITTSNRINRINRIRL